jgi:membrane-bound lytic murein transglycosylase B
MYRFLTLVFFLLTPLVTASSDYAGRPEVQEFVRELAEEGDFDERELLSIFKHAEYKQSIIDAISRPAEKTLTWAEYQDIFLTDRRTSSGVAFMLENREALEEAYRVYGVPPVIVTAIIGVETMYGRITGGYRVLDALATLSFDYPPRSRFFKGELKQLILLAREEKQMITDLKGSYAGAMGLGQFIPSSYRHYAVDFDGDGFRDIWNNPTDAIGSVANYLIEHGWQRDADITFAVDGARVPEDVFNVSLKPSKSISELESLGMKAELGMLDKDQQVSPMRFSGKMGDEFWIGLKNFYVITRYNHSKLYAMAVFQLSEDLKKGSDAIVAR